jgi:hypothetical protein
MLRTPAQGPLIFIVAPFAFALAFTSDKGNSILSTLEVHSAQMQLKS